MVKIGEVDVASQILESEYRIGVLERVVDLLTTRMPVIGGAISPSEVEAIRRDVVAALQKKYPSSGIALKGEGNG